MFCTHVSFDAGEQPRVIVDESTLPEVVGARALQNLGEASWRGG